MQKSQVIPSDITVTVTGDQSDKTRTTLHDLINTIIIGFILVILVLMFLWVPPIHSSSHYLFRCLWPLPSWSLMPWDGQ